MIKFSCIITCYNREELIQRAISSILNQSFQNFEIIIVDDGSTDKSVEKIGLSSDKRIKLIIHEKNSGQNAAINTGIAASNYEYLAFLDSDDEWFPNYLQEMHDTYISNPNISFAYSGSVSGPSAGLDGEFKYSEVLNQGYLSSMITITAKKSAVNCVGNFDERYTICQDDDFCFRLAKNYSFKAIPKSLAVIHVSTNSMTKNILKVAEGWAFLFGNYKDEIIEYCGYKTLSKHYLDVSKLFFRVKKFKKGLHYYFLAIKFFFKPIRSNKFNYPLSMLLKETWIIARLNLGHIKRFILGNNDRRN